MVMFSGLLSILISERFPVVIAYPRYQTDRLIYGSAHESGPGSGKLLPPDVLVRRECLSALGVELSSLMDGLSSTDRSENWLCWLTFGIEDFDELHTLGIISQDVFQKATPVVKLRNRSRMLD